MRFLVLFLLSLLPVAALATPPTYVCGRATTPLQIDGKGLEQDWQQARELSPFKDIEGSTIPHNCRVRMLWDDDYLYILADMDEQHLWATKTEHDSIIYHDPDFEVFIDPDGDGLNYIELEINALNTTWDLFITRPYRFNDPHILHDWEIKGLKHGVHLRGTLNNASDTDDCWSVELAIPWSSITSHAHLPRTSKAPQPGTCMRMNFSRVNWQVTPTPTGYSKLPAPESNHVWAPTGKINIHMPEHWGRVLFSQSPANKWESCPPDYSETARLNLYQALNTQLAHRNEHGTFNQHPQLPEDVEITFPAKDFFVLTTTCKETGTQMRLDSEGRFAATQPDQPKTPLYLWVHGNNERSTTEWQQRFTSYAEAGINTVIIDGTTERIAALTPLAKAAGLRVFAWFWALNRPGDAIALQHPEWYAVNALGKSCHQPQERPFVEYYQFLCPNHPEVQQHLLNQVRQLAAIPGLDGIQADYMRLPDVELPRGLWQKYGLDMSQVLPEYDYCYCATCKDACKTNDWKAFRQQSIARLYNKLAAEIRRHGLTAACAVFPSPSLAARMVHQDWSLFHADLVLPMVYHSFYNEPASWAAETTRAALRESHGRIPMAPGLHLPDSPPAALRQHLDSLRSTGVHGIGIFSDDELTPEHLQEIRKFKQGHD
jgi:uncharacterized lipoprotein YddW (UPF0748 family)